MNTIQKNTVLRILLLLIAFSFLQESSFSQIDSASENLEKYRKLKNPEGKEFWLCFQKNYKDSKKSSTSSELQLELFITGEKDAKVEIEIKGIEYSKNFFVPAGSVKNIKIPPAAQLKSDGVIEQLAVHIVSDVSISVYGLNRRFQTTDTYLGLPVKVLGKEYRAMCYSISVGYTPQFAVVAAEDSTHVVITPTVNTVKHDEDEEFSLMLNKGEVYQVVAKNEKFSSCDLTGSLIKANKKIAVFSGHQCAYVPRNIIACNHLVEQLPPIPSWGKHFYLGKLKPRSNYTYRVLANEAQTKVFADSKLVKILNGGEFYEDIATKNIQLTASKPVLVAQYSQGFKNGDSLGDPMMLLISPTQQFLQHYRFATPVNGFWKHSVNIVAPTKAIGTIKLDGRKLDTNLFQPLGISRYSIAYLNVPFGSHNLSADMPFGMYSYGFGYDAHAFDAYGTMGGQSFVEYEPSKDTLAPECDMKNDPKLKSLSKAGIVFRDDHVDDSGIRDIEVLESSGLQVNIPKFEEGILQVEVAAAPTNSQMPGRVVFGATDVALNKSEFTLCYYYSNISEEWIYELNEGVLEECATTHGYQIGLFLKPSANIHSADFSSSGNVVSYGDFSNALGLGGYGGIVLSKKYRQDFGLSAKLSFEKYNGVLASPDSIFSYMRDNNNYLKSVQESRELSVDALFMHLSINGEYFFKSYLYAIGGLNFAFTLSDDITLVRKALIPEDFLYKENNAREIIEDGSPESMGSFNSIRIGAFGGIGVTYPISKDFTAFAEGIYTYHLSNMIDDGDWNLQQLSFLIGVKYNL